MPIDPRENERRLALYGQGLGDQAMARALGIKRESVRDWRKSRGLASNGRPPPTAAAMECRMALYRTGMLDGAIAEAQGVRRAAIHMWRRARGLPSHRRSFRRGLNPVDAGRRLALYSAGCTDGQIAEALDLLRATIKSWRQRWKLPPNGTGFLSPEVESDRMELYGKGLNDEQIGKAVGRSSAAIKKWRKRRGFPSHPVRRAAFRKAVQRSTLLSLDMVASDGGLSLHSYVKDDSLSEQLEEIGATVW